MYNVYMILLFFFVVVAFLSNSLLPSCVCVFVVHIFFFFLLSSIAHSRAYLLLFFFSSLLGTSFFFPLLFFPFMVFTDCGFFLVYIFVQACFRKCVCVCVFMPLDLSQISNRVKYFFRFLCIGMFLLLYAFFSCYTRHGMPNTSMLSRTHTLKHKHTVQN